MLGIFHTPSGETGKCSSLFCQRFTFLSHHIDTSPIRIKTQPHNKTVGKFPFSSKQSTSDIIFHHIFLQAIWTLKWWWTGTVFYKKKKKTLKKYLFHFKFVFILYFNFTRLKISDPWSLNPLRHICVGKLTIIGSDNGLSPGRRQAIIWTNAGILLIGPLGTNFNEIFIEIHTFSFKKIHLKMSSGKWRPFCLGLNVLKYWAQVRPTCVSKLDHHWFR